MTAPAVTKSGPPRQGRFSLRLARAMPALLLLNFTALCSAGVLLAAGLSDSERPPLILALIAVAAVCSFGLVVLTREIVGQVRETTRAMRDLSGGQSSAELALPRIKEMQDMVLSFNAMSQRLRSSRQLLLRQAFVDPLTGLANRASFMARLSTAVATNKGRDVAVVFVDLDRFKNVNDSLGHAIGDSLLSVVGGRLQAAAGPDILVARLGGDEFTLLIEGQAAESRALAAAERIVSRMGRPIAVSGHELFVSASAGIAVSERRTTPTELLRRADIALYRAKDEGRGRVVLFRLAKHDVQPEHLALDTALHRAIERQQLRLYYQPEINIATGAVAGMEALLRWDHPHLGVLSPAQFLDIAEDSGEIAHISQWVMREACRQAVAFGKSFNAARSLVVSINLTGPDFRDPNLCERVAAVLKETDLEPSRLRIELTESLLVEDIQATAATLQALRDLGIGVAIDDFGTGYSSLSYIQDFAVSTLKVDQSFVRRIGQDHRSDAIIGAIGQLARALDMELTAEGVETEAQLSFLRGAGYQYVQGHHFAPPLDAVAFEKFLRERSASASAYPPSGRVSGQRSA